MIGIQVGGPIALFREGTVFFLCRYAFSSTFIVIEWLYWRSIAWTMM